ncbi:MAG: hypothetical protein L0Y66_22605 [Myxococcaceae bacterium]|nr:hypothetical protein [Myxococcaceae bacterium]MCI0673114.1 hypothetical protein [Myxococcaceae bacterium]
MSSLRSAALPALLLPLLLACAHTEPRGSLAELRPVVDQFHHALRWRDFRGAASVWVEEEREAFEKARRTSRDERDLHVTDYELLDAKLLPDGQKAKVTSRIQWYRLPSVTEETETVVSHFVLRAGVWQLERQEGGPFSP